MKAKNAILEMEWPAPLVPPPVIIAQAPWIRSPASTLLAFAPPKLIDIATLVTSQENACRYCYGAIRSAMLLSGYSDEQILDLERDVQMADGLTREVVSLSRKLARSNPRPVRQELQALQGLGLGPKAVAEIVYLVATTCYANRVGTFLSLPPDRKFERSVENPFRRFIGPLMMRVSSMRTRRVGPSSPVEAEGVLAPLVRALPDAPVAAWFAGLVSQCFAAPHLSRRAKLLILAVVARTLTCRFCEDAARADLERLGLERGEFAKILDTLSGPGVTPEEALLLDWARETVHYETGSIQKRTRALLAAVGTEVLIEAVAMAALSNTAVRLAMLLE